MDLQVQYISPLKVNDVAVIETRFMETAAAKICFEYIIRRQSDGALVARGSSVQVFINGKGDMELTNPVFYEEWKKRWLTKK